MAVTVDHRRIAGKAESPGLFRVNPQMMFGRPRASCGWGHLSRIMTRRAPFTQASAERAIKAARKVGLRVTGMSIRPDGTISIHTSEDPPVHSLTPAPKLRDAREKLGVR